jgi:hypothetical protein
MRAAHLLTSEKARPLYLDSRGPRGASNKGLDPCATDREGTTPTIRRGHYSGGECRHSGGAALGGPRPQGPAAGLLHW